MTKLSRLLAAAVVLTAASAAWATPSTTFWTPATNYVQPYLVPHVTYDTYVSERGGFQNDYGLTVGFLPFEKLQGEIGADSFLPGLQKSNFYLNGKLAVPEGALGEWAPGVSAGAYAVGFDRNISDYNILHAEIGKTFPVIGNLVAGGYYGLNSTLMVSSSGKKEQAGFLGAWTSPDIVINKPGLNKIVFMADVQTGKNAFGAWGAGLGLYFTPAIDILTGPVFFFDSAKTAQIGVSGAKNPDWLWTIQLDVDIDFRSPPPKT